MTSRPAHPLSALTLLLAVALAASAPAQQSPVPAAPQPPAQGTGVGQKTQPSGTPARPASGQDAESASKPASAGEAAASPALQLGPLDPSTPPTDLPRNRPVIGLALGGGAALSLTDIGVLEWLEEHRIPVDVIAGTSMGSIIGALYATGHTPEEMKHLLTPNTVDTVFRIDPAYSARSFRRRADSRDVPNAITIGLAHGVSFRNSLLSDTGLNELLDKEFLRYNDQTDFNSLPIPFRCQATDLNAARTVTFSRGSLQDAVRASASIPGVFRPFQLDGHEFVDGAILENLPTPDVKAMNATVILAVSIGLAPVANGDLNSILGVLQRAFAVGIEANERQDRKLANVVIQPDVAGFTSNDYLRTQELAIRGYLAAEANKAALMRYSVSEAQWQTYLAHRDARLHGAPGPVLRVKIAAPNDSVKAYATRQFAPLVGQPIDTGRIEKLLADLRSDGRYDADYTVGYEDPHSDLPIILVTVSDKKTGPPFLDVGLNIAAQTGGVTRANVDTILIQQDLGGYGSELRSKINVGFSTLLESEYYRKLDYAGFFVAPRANLERQPFYIYRDNFRLSERQYQTGGGGFDLGWGNGRDQELRLGYQLQNIQWYTTTGADSLPDFNGNAQRSRLRYVYDSQDRALVPRFGVRSTTEVAYLFATPGSPSTPQIYQQLQVAQGFGKNTVLLSFEGATMLNHDVAQPFRYTLGGPLRLAASSIDQYRGTDYFLVTPGYLRRIHSLGAPLNSSLSLGGTFELGQMRAPDSPNLTRYDVYFGLISETPLGVISFGPAVGNGGERKLVFTIGRLF